MARPCASGRTKDVGQLGRGARASPTPSDTGSTAVTRGRRRSRCSCRARRVRVRRRASPRGGGAGQDEPPPCSAERVSGGDAAAAVHGAGAAAGRTARGAAGAEVPALITSFAMHPDPGRRWLAVGCTPPARCCWSTSPPARGSVSQQGDPTALGELSCKARTPRRRSRPRHRPAGCCSHPRLAPLQPGPAAPRAGVAGRAPTGPGTGCG